MGRSRKYKKVRFFEEHFSLAAFGNDHHPHRTVITPTPLISTKEADKLWYNKREIRQIKRQAKAEAEMLSKKNDARHDCIESILFDDEQNQSYPQSVSVLVDSCDCRGLDKYVFGDLHSIKQKKVVGLVHSCVHQMGRTTMKVRPEIFRTAISTLTERSKVLAYTQGVADAIVARGIYGLGLDPQSHDLLPTAAYVTTPALLQFGPMVVFKSVTTNGKSKTLSSSIKSSPPSSSRRKAARRTTGQRAMMSSTMNTTPCTVKNQTQKKQAFSMILWSIMQMKSLKLELHARECRSLPIPEYEQ